jgi:glyoxylase I family protein
LTLSSGSEVGSTSDTEYIHHLTLRVRDLDRSRRFYSDVLGVDIEALDDRLRFAVGATRIVLRPPLEGTPGDDRFSERRIGLDHISFGVQAHQSLERLVERLRAHGIATEGIQFNADPEAEFVAFRDPDNIQLEFFRLDEAARQA